MHGRKSQLLPSLGRSRTGADLDTMLERGGLIWMLARVQYQTNVVCIRVAEVGGASGLIVTGEWTGDDRHRIVRATMQQSLHAGCVRL